jgi:hypothetical protein
MLLKVLVAFKADIWIRAKVADIKRFSAFRASLIGQSVEVS